MRRLIAALAVLSLGGCATPSRDGPPPIEPPQAVTPQRPPISAPSKPAPLAELPGWAQEDHDAAFAAFRRTCPVTKDAAIAAVCAQARLVREVGLGEARRFLEQAFEARLLPGEGVLTAYFAPVYPARSQPDAEFSAPVRPRPTDLKPGEGGAVFRILGDGSTEPYPDRASIEVAPVIQPLAWMRPEELFFLQVQGSGVLIFEGGRRQKALFSAHNGRPFVGIANPMRDLGLLARDNTSGDAIRMWLAAHRGPEADDIMRLNPRYAFFSLAPDDGKPVFGAAGVPLPTGRAVAVDPAFHAMGELLWLDAQAPLLAGAFPVYQRMVTALDTGGAIKGAVRADLFLGQGEAAGAEAGRVRHTLRLYQLVPK